MALFVCRKSKTFPFWFIHLGAKQKVPFVSHETITARQEHVNTGLEMRHLYHARMVEGGLGRNILKPGNMGNVQEQLLRP